MPSPTRQPFIEHRHMTTNVLDIRPLYDLIWNKTRFGRDALQLAARGPLYQDYRAATAVLVRSIPASPGWYVRICRMAGVGVTDCNHLLLELQSASFRVHIACERTFRRDRIVRDWNRACYE